MKRSAGDEDGPGQKRLVRRREGQARGSAATARMIFPPFPPLMPWIEETMWSGTLEFKNRPHSNDQRQPVDIISGKIRFFSRINTDNWPKQLKMTTITKDDFRILRSLGVRSQIGLSTCIFSVDDDCDKMSYGAFIQCTRFPYFGCALLEYSSSVIQVLILYCGSLQGEMITVGIIKKYSNNDRTVKLLTDLGILPHATIYMYNNSSLKKKLKQKSKEVSSLKEELQQKDKREVELAIHYQEKIKNLNQTAEENSQEIVSLVMERDENQRRIETQEREIDTQRREIERLKNEAERVLVEQKHQFSKERTKIMADSWRNQERIRNEVKAEQTQESLKLINKLNKIKNKYSELENEACSRKQAILDDIEKEFFCTICQHTLTKAQTLNCGHSFCTQCIENRGMLTNDGNAKPCPNCKKPRTTNVPSIDIDSCIEEITRLRNVATGQTETEGEPMSVGSDDESTSASSPSSSGSSSSSFCRNPSSIENMFSPASSSDSD